MWCPRDYDDVSEDDEQSKNGDLTRCTILLMAQEKRMLREPQQEALMVKLFDKGIEYMQVKK